MWRSVCPPACPPVCPPDLVFGELSHRKQPPFPPVTDSDSVQFTDGDYLIMLCPKSEKRNFDTFQDV